MKNIYFNKIMPVKDFPQLPVEGWHFLVKYINVDLGTTVWNQDSKHVTMSLS